MGACVGVCVGEGVGYGVGEGVLQHDEDPSSDVYPSGHALQSSDDDDPVPLL